MENMQQVPNGGMLMVSAPAPAPQATAQGGTSTDPRIWRPKVTKTNTTYKAVVRALPNGRNLNAYPYVSVMIHRLRDLNSGKTLTVKCCKNIPGERNCPFCEDVWARYRAAKEQPGATKDSLKRYLQQLPEEEWYGNFLIRQDANHPEYNNQVKVWPHSKYQHAAFQEPVDKYNEKLTKAAQGITDDVNVDTGDAFVPYDPTNGYDYVLNGVWDAEKSFGTGRKGAPTYKGSAFAKNPSPLFTKTVVDPATNVATSVIDTESIYAILDQCHDLSFVMQDIPTPQEAIAMLQKFWDDANALSRQKAASGYQAGYGAGAQQMGVAPAAVAPAYAAQPFQTGAQMPMGMQPGTQNSIPQVPANAKITSNTNPAAFMGQAAPQQQMAPAVPNVQMPAPIPAAAAPVTPAFAPNPAFAPAPAAPAPAAPAFPQAAPAPQFGMPQAAPVAPAPAAPAAPVAPQQQAYVPPAAPPLAQPASMMPPQAGPTPIVETDSEDDLPFD